MLSLDEPLANILLTRHVHYNQPFATEIQDTSGENWMAPFSHALGLESAEFRPWRDVFLSKSEALLLVEGSTDKQYFEMVRDTAHGSNQLKFDGEIVSYDGIGNLKNTVLLRFLKDRYRRLFVTYDLDAERHVEHVLRSLGFEKGKHYLGLGMASAGRRNIEGLLPDSVTKAVFTAHPDKVQAAMGGDADEQRRAKRELKNLLLEEFRRVATPGDDAFGEFYKASRIIGRALNPGK
jgi:hypothetical protein